MGYQKMNDNGQMQANADKNVSAAQRTSNVSRLAQDTSKCQYERLSNTTPDKGTTGE